MAYGAILGQMPQIDGIPAVIRTYPIATGQTINQGDVVDIVGGQVTTTLVPQANVEEVFTSNSVSSTNMAKLNDLYSIVAYHDVNFKVLLLDNTTSKAVGEPVAIYGGEAPYPSLTVLDENTFCAGLVRNDVIRVFLLHASGGSISNQIYSADITNSVTTYNCLVALSSNAFLAVYNRSGLKAKVCTVSGTSITAGTEFSLSSNASASYISATRLPDSGTTRRVCVCYADGGNSNAGTAVIVSIDAGNNVTWGSPVVFESSSSPFVASASVTYNGENIVVCYSMTNNYVFVKTLSPSNLAEISNLELGSEFRANSNTLTSGQLGKTTIVTVGPSNSIALVINDSSSGLSIGGNFVFNSSLSQYISMVAVSSTEVVLAYVDNWNSSYGTATTLTVSGNQIAGSFLDSSKDAIALQSGTAGQSIEVIYSGTVNASWMTEGQVISSPGVYGIGVLDGVLQVWSAERPMGAQIEMGSYVGNGRSGSSSPLSVTTNFAADIISIIAISATDASIPNVFTYYNSYSPVIMSQVGTSWTRGIGFSLSGSSLTNTWAQKSIDGKTLYWYGNSVQDCANESGTTYYYIAIKFSNGG